MAKHTPFERLQLQRGYTLQKISPTTYPQDVINAQIRADVPLTRTEIESIVALLKTGSAFRCRIGKGRYCYGRTADEAINAALRAEGRSS